ncbi:hypothetical protein BKA70DRAFT_1294129 [Coprinopsis sp. MPI-PUGE-AT-0042]|nr:hypothetical protein BKA70DRAFT_1294129 [Coprinopsis sp. MPI-PUGE-AT-0042]
MQTLTARVVSPTASCPTFFRVQSWLSQVAMLAMNVIVVKRVVCMYSGDKKVLWALTITLSTLTVHGAILTVLMSDIPSVVARIQSTHLYEVCEPFPTESTPSWYWTFVIFMFVFEALVFGLALLQVVSFVRERRQTRRDWDGASMLGHVWKTRRDLASVLLRDSILFPFINLIIATLNILVWAAELSPNSAESIRLVAAVTVPMFGCRLLLNLRDIYYEPFREEYNLSRFQRGPSDVIN